MQAKRLSSAAGLAPKRSRTRAHSVSSDAADTLTIQALPTDVLALVFEYTPFLARLRALSFVCKRWRAAALRSIHHRRTSRSLGSINTLADPMHPTRTSRSTPRSPR